MLLETNNLVRISTYANKHYINSKGEIGCSTDWICKLIQQGRINTIDIDGTAHINLSDIPVVKTKPFNK